MLKNAIDSVFATFAFRNKPAACGLQRRHRRRCAGHRALGHTAIEAEMVPLRNNLVLFYVTEAFGQDGNPNDPRTEAAAKVLLDDLAWWAVTLHRARSGGALPLSCVTRPARTRAKEREGER